MKRRTAVRVISFCVTAALIFAGFALKSRTETKNYRLQIQNGYSRSLEELLSGVNNISVILKKAEYTSSAKQMSNIGGAAAYRIGKCEKRAFESAERR